MKTRNICFKYDISKEELDKIIHLVLDEVPVDKLSASQIEVIFDLLRNGDVDKNDKHKEMDVLNFFLSNVLIGCLDCEKCLAKDACKSKNSADAKIVDCFQNLLFLMQAVDLPETTSELKKSTVKEYVEKTLINDEEFKLLLDKEKGFNDANL